MAVRSPSNTALRDACREFADGNLGFISIYNKIHRKEIESRYKQSDEVGITDANSITEEHIGTVMENLVDDTEVPTRVENGVYYISPFKRANVETHRILIPRLLNVFDDENWYVGETRLINHLVRDEIIADDHLSFFLDDLVERGWLEGTEGYYKPGNHLEQLLVNDDPTAQLGNILESEENNGASQLHQTVENATSKSIKERMEEKADDGLLSVEDIQRVLSISVTDAFIEDELIDADILYRIDDNKFFVNNQSAINDRIKGEIVPNSEFVDEFEREMRHSKYIFTNRDITEWIMIHIKNTSSETRKVVETVADDYRENIINHAKEEFETVSQLVLVKKNFESETMQHLDETPYNLPQSGNFFICQNKFKTSLQDEVDKKLEEAAEKLNGPPGNDRKILDPAIDDFKKEKEKPDIAFGTTDETETVFINRAIDLCWQRGKNNDLWEYTQEVKR
jgi:hypothetical protein